MLCKNTSCFIPHMLPSVFLWLVWIVCFFAKVSSKVDKLFCKYKHIHKASTNPNRTLGFGLIFELLLVLFMLVVCSWRGTQVIQRRNIMDREHGNDGSKEGREQRQGRQQVKPESKSKWLRLDETERKGWETGWGREAAREISYFTLMAKERDFISQALTDVLIRRSSWCMIKRSVWESERGRTRHEGARERQEKHGGGNRVWGRRKGRWEGRKD